MEELTFEQRVAASVARGREIEAEAKRIMAETEIISRKIRRRNNLERACIALGCNLEKVTIGEFGRLLNVKKREMGL